MRTSAAVFAIARSPGRVAEKPVHLTGRHGRFLPVHGELSVVPANTPERTRHCGGSARPNRYVVRSQPRDEDTRGVRSVDTSRETDSPPKPSHADHAAI